MLYVGTYPFLLRPMIETGPLATFSGGPTWRMTGKYLLWGLLSAVQHCGGHLDSPLINATSLIPVFSVNLHLRWIEFKKNLWLTCHEIGPSIIWWGWFFEPFREESFKYSRVLSHAGICVGCSHWLMSTALLWNLFSSRPVFIFTYGLLSTRAMYWKD